MGLIVLIFMTFSTAALASQDACVNTGQLLPPIENKELWIGLSKEFAIEAAKKNLKGFCEWNRMDRFTGEVERTRNPSVVANYREAKTSGNLGSAAAILKPEGKIKPWDASMLGNKTLKDRGSSYFVQVCKQKTAINCAEELASTLEKPNFKGHYRTMDYQKIGALSVSKMEVAGACAYLSPLSTIGCASASGEVLKLAEIHRAYGVQVSNLPMIKETLSEPKITGALQRVASGI